ncbi:unnamed protein product [Ilex paraguariensis]|uniref:RING-type E3 ubiquitin transferase n=1 Tax=Ilex paraguariensis TaxID=185542 RepID=A0ABC8QVS1_9AQUA
MLLFLQKQRSTLLHMDEYSGKRAVGGLVVPRRGSNLVLRDTPENRDQNPQFCNRIGCNGRLNYSKGTQTGSSGKLKSPKPSFRSSGKEIIGSSSRTCSLLTNTRKSFQESQKKQSSQLETDSSETSSVQDEPEVPELIPSLTDTGFNSEAKNAEPAKVTLMEGGSSSVAPNSRTRKVFRPKSVLINQDTLPGSPLSLAAKSTGQGARNSTNAGRYGLRNLRCNSISDVLPQGCSSLEPNTGTKRYIVKNRNPEGESSSSVRGKKMNGPLFEDGRTNFSNGGISICDSRRGRNFPPTRDCGVASVRNRRSMSGNARMALSNQANGSNSSRNESPVYIPQAPQPNVVVNETYPSSSHQFSSEASSRRSSSYSRPAGSGDNITNMMPISPAEVGMTHYMSHDGLRRYNMDGIAEVLLALERIEQDEDLTYEQLLALETNLFLGGLNLYDQHRDMRLDIDDMSYEELLALEEKMGNVSTALSEDALSKCLRRSTYQSTPTEEGTMGCNGDGDDSKCSVCQVEYAVGDEVGKLGCDHGYHVECIRQWLRLKNWCPICKTSVAPSESFSPSYPNQMG